MRILKVIAVFVFLLLNFFCFAQGGFKKKYHLQNSLSSICYKATEMPNGEIIMFGLTYDTLDHVPSNRLTLIRTTPDGNTILWRKDYGSYKFEYLDWINPRSIVQTDNAFYFIIAARDSNNKQVGALIKFDLNGDTLWQKVFRDPVEDFIPSGLTQSVDNGFLFTGFFQNWSNNTSPCMLVKTDKNGNELWRKKIHKSIPDAQDGKVIVQDTATKKIIIVGYQYIGSASNFGTHSNILILDSLGNKKIQTTFNNYGGGPFGELIQLRDKNFITCGSLNANSDIGLWTRYQSFVVKFDTNGGIIWSKVFDIASPYNSLDCVNELPNGDLLITGFLDTMLNHNLEEVIKVKLLKLDKDGNLKGWKYIGSSYNHESSEGPTSINSTKDSGFLITTGFSNEVPRPYSIIKIDSTGCDTLEEWCRSVALNISSFAKTTGWDFELFPNPARDFVKLRIDAPADKSFAVKIHDVSGKETGNFQLNSGNDLHLNTSDYKPGLYFVELLYEDKTIDTRKLLIMK